MKIARSVVFLCMTLLTSCSGDDPKTVDDGPLEPSGRLTPVRIVTRVSGGDGNSLNAGLFMVNYQDGKPGELEATDNYVNNQALTYTTEGWTSDTPIYWSDMETRADFFAYAPYRQTIDDVRHMTFDVCADQRGDDDYNQSDFLWGAIQGQMPSADGFELTLSHVMSKLTIAVVADIGFDEDELQAADISVAIGGSRLSCMVDLASGLTTVMGEPQNVICHNNGDLTYTAVLVPQAVPFSNLIQIDWKGNKYTLQNSFTLEARRQYSLTVKLKKSKNGFDIGIAGWDIVDEDFGGVIGG